MKIEARSTWGPTAELGHPMPGVPTKTCLHWTVTTPTDDPYADMRLIERIGVENFGRFSYSYCYHPVARLVLEGAGQTIGAHTHGHNSTGLGLAVIARPGTPLGPHVAEDLASLHRDLIAGGRLEPGTYPTAGHRDVRATECPGDELYALIPTIRRLITADVEHVQEDDMTPAERKMLQEIHAELCTSKPPPPEGTAGRPTLRWMVANIRERTGHLVTGQRPQRR